MFALERVASDAGSFFLPLIGPQMQSQGMIPYRSEWFSAVSSLQMFATLEKNKERQPKYPLHWQTNLKPKTEKVIP